MALSVCSCIRLDGLELTPENLGVSVGLDGRSVVEETGWTELLLREKEPRMSVQIDPKKLTMLDTLTINSGCHEDFYEGHCSMEIVSWLAGEGFTDAPDCASEVLRRFVIPFNDRCSSETRQLLKPYLPRMVGTGDDGKDALREQVAMEAVLTVLLAPWLRLAGMDVEADRLTTLVDEPLAVQREALWAIRFTASVLRDSQRDNDPGVRGPSLNVAVAADAALAAAGAGALAAAIAADVASFSDGANPAAALAAVQQDYALNLLGRLIDPPAPVAV